MTEAIIVTDSSKCKQCYSCVRNCPVKAVRIKDGKAEVIQNRCIQCGKCVKHCSRNAKKIQSCIPDTESILHSGRKAIALLAPSYVAGLYPLTPQQIIGKLGALGFDEAWETAIGAEYVIDHSAEYAEANSDKILLSSPCPTLVNLVEKHFPDIIPNLIPISSPMIATGRIIRQKYKDEDVGIVFIGPCIAKKDEVVQEQFKGCINTALTYEELGTLFEGIGEKDGNYPVEKPIPYYTASSKGRRIPLSGGIISNLRGKFAEDSLISCDGAENCIELIKHIEQSKRKDEQDFMFYDVLCCRGCIDSACMKNDLLIHERQKIITDFAGRKYDMPTEVYFTGHYDIDMGRTFNNRMIPLRQPDEVSIKRILASIEKFSEEDELNCGACGYDTCRGKATAVYQGIAEVEMCIPYLLSQKSECYVKLSEAFDTVNSLNEELNAIFESSYDGMVVCDASGRIIKANSSWKKMVGVEEIPETAEELERDGIICPSAAILALKEKRRVTFLQECKSQRKFIATGNPIYDEKGEIIGVVTNIRDIEELSRLKRNVIKKNKKDTSAYPGIITHSQEFGKVLELAAQAAKYKSTVLLLGETGVGKDVVSRLIHHLSPVKDGPYIKVNCGAIPEKLLESEFFGYEYGAFTGAVKGGKTGYFEQSDKGTIFLDEIADLPLSLQVKLLQVIQDKAIRRIGSSKSENIDIRIIAATNNDLRKMVDEGRFREDLYYRLNVISIHIPPLRERKGDIIPLANYFLEVFNKQYGCSKEFAPDVPSVLYSYYWPGNVRELQNIIERMVVTSRDSEIACKDIPPYINQIFKVRHGQIIVNGIIPLREAVSEVEKQIISRAYKAYGNTYKIAEALGVNQSTIVRKLKNLEDQT
ncbi:MAG TPA: sigma 54-interacting transcriptional regulator [Clostridia bacterium]|nr:sigma 54-interacting transcriptional regulator [Clostridia bacterium]